MKKVIFGIAALALFAGCAQNEVTRLNPTAPDQISFSPNTTRAEVNSISSAGFDPGGTGFSVWATAEDVPDWYGGIEGLAHLNTGGVWGFDPAIAWAPAANYPMNFYAVYPNVSTPAALAGFAANADPGTDPGEQTLSFDYTVHPDRVYTKPDPGDPYLDRESQIDLLGAKATANVKPASSNLSIEFKHLLSKINFGVRVETGMALRTQGITVNYVGNQGTYTFADGTPGYTPQWTTQPSTFDQVYTYAGIIWAEDQLNTAGDPSTLRSMPIAFGNNTYEGGASVQEIFKVADSLRLKHLFLMPQQADGDDSTPDRTLSVDNGKLDETMPLDALDGKSYITMMYRLNQNSVRLVGYNSASDHPFYKNHPTITEVSDFTAPLFVKAVFPFELKWEPGKGYQYVIPFNTSSATGGYLADKFYYDNCGNRTNLVVGDILGDGVSQGPHPGDPILVSDGNIHLIPIVTDWDDTDARINLP